MLQYFHIQINPGGKNSHRHLHLHPKTSTAEKACEKHRTANSQTDPKQKQKETQ